jgi:hypothetical protein
MFARAFGTISCHATEELPAAIGWPALSPALLRNKFIFKPCLIDDFKNDAETSMPKIGKALNTPIRASGFLWTRDPRYGHATSTATPDKIVTCLNAPSKFGTNFFRCRTFLLQHGWIILALDPKIAHSFSKQLATTRPLDLSTTAA